MEKVKNILKKLFIKEDGSVALKRILGTLIVLGYLGVSLWNGQFDNPVAILTLLFAGV